MERLDAVVIGGSTRGLVAAHVLSSLGYRAVLLERAPRVGGADGSFTTAGGTRFDHGLHVLDYNRSELATRLFTHVVDGHVHRLALRRAIVLRGQLMPYAPRPEEMPEALRALLPARAADGELVDDLGDAPPTREALARFYGQGFADLIFDEVLPSYPTEARHQNFGVEPSRLLTNVYPWLFPRARRKPVAGDPSRAFHDKLRAGHPQEILYPVEGGMGGFAEGFVRKLDPERVEVLTGVDDLHVELRPGTHTVEWIGAAGRRFAATHVFWAAAWPPLCELLDLPCQEIATDRMLLGSFRFDRKADTDYHEILVGDPQLPINRISFPAALRRSDDPLLQIEFAFPLAEERPTDPEFWLDAWLDGLRRLRLVGGSHGLEEFEFKTFPMHYNAFGMEGEPLVDADPTLLRGDSNVRPVVPSMANLNLNAYVPEAAAYVASVLAASPPS